MRADYLDFRETPFDLSPICFAKISCLIERQHYNADLLHIRGMEACMERR